MENKKDTMKLGGMRPIHLILGVIFTTAGLAYTFWGLDMIADPTPYIGFLDDAGVMIALWILFNRAKKIVK